MHKVPVPIFACQSSRNGLSLVPSSSDIMSLVRFHKETGQITHKGDSLPLSLSKDGRTSKTLGAIDWLAQLTTHIPSRNEQMVRYCGYYSNKSRGMQRQTDKEDDMPRGKLVCPLLSKLIDFSILRCHRAPVCRQSLSCQGLRVWPSGVLRYRCPSRAARNIYP